MVGIAKTIRRSAPIETPESVCTGNDIALRCTGVSKRFGNVQAVSGLDLTAKTGQILALLGPSGCGKTTTLRVIAGFEHPDEGEVIIGGRVVSTPLASLPPERRRIGMVFQEGALFPNLTVEQNIAYGLKDRQGHDVRVTEALELVGMPELRSRMPHELSGGQQQRVALGRALAPRPDILLLDEPFSNLDANLSEKLRRDVSSILRDSGVTAVFVTHDQEAALQVGDEVALMNEGHVEQAGSPGALFHSPVTRFAAEFLGAVDFLPVNVSEGLLASPLGPVDNQESVAAYLGGLNGNSWEQSLEIMVRPDCLECIPDNEGTARIVDREFRGAFYLYRVLLENGHRVRCLMSHVNELPVGTRVSVHLRPGHVTRLFVDGRMTEPSGACR